MTTYWSRYAFAVAGFVAASNVAPLVTVAAAATTSPNMIDNATADVRVAHAPVTGIYDANDKYRDARGFPLAGWEYLFIRRPDRPRRA